MYNQVLPAFMDIRFPSSGFCTELETKAERPVASIDVRQSGDGLLGPIRANEDAERARSGL